ncbi:MAG TPA: hypothetical protein VN372_08700 [Methanospirillum sp.]|nr:hypothetical protein [Methanospirillum sp.]
MTTELWLSPSYDLLERTRQYRRYVGIQLTVTNRVVAGMLA